MEFLTDKKKTTVILRDGEILEVQTLKGNPLRIEIKCINGSFLINEVTVKKIKEMKLEQEQLDILNKLNNSNE